MLYPPFCKKKMTHLRDLFSDRNGAVLYPDCALYEVGGNIGKLKSLHCSLWSKQGWHSHVFLLIELMRVARSYVMKCASAKQTWAVHLQLSEQTNAYYTHTRLCCHRRVDTVNRKKNKTCSASSALYKTSESARWCLNLTQGHCFNTNLNSEKYHSSSSRKIIYIRIFTAFLCFM